jgi:hypothetical protein
VTAGALFVPGVRLPDVTDDAAEESRSEGPLHPHRVMSSDVVHT